MKMSKYLQNAVVKMTLDNTLFTSPATVYLALLTSISNDGSSYTEVSSGGYARKSISFDAAASGKTQNSAKITFSTPTANWGPITHVAIFDASTSGNMLFYDDFDLPITAFVDQIVRLPLGDIEIEIAGDIPKTFKNTLINTILRNSAYAATTGYVALLYAVSSDGDTYSEISGAGYARQSMSVSSPSNGIVKNSAALEFPTATDDYSDAFTHIGIFDAVSSGNLMYLEKLPSSREVLEDQVYRIPMNEITVTID